MKLVELAMVQNIKHCGGLEVLFHFGFYEVKIPQ
jgi:hypothetical protein